MGQLVIFALLGVVIYLWLKNKALANSADTPSKSQATAPKTTLQPSPITPPKRPLKAISAHNQTAEKPLPTRPQTSPGPSLNTGIPELDGPGMYQRLNGCGPQGHVCYLLHSPSHAAYKVGICRPDRLGTRINTIRNTVPDVQLVGTAVFTSHQNAFNAEQLIIRNNRSTRYRGISGGQAGGTEWLSRRPTQRRPAFSSPKFVEERYARQSEAPLPTLIIPDEYTIYLAFSQQRNAYKAKWCRSDNLNQRLEALRDEQPDTEILFRIKIARHEQAREITKQMNERNGSYSRVGRRDVISWSTNPSYLHAFQNWDSDGNNTAP